MAKGSRKVAQAARREQPGGRDWRIALILLAALAVYANSLSGPFVFDDRGTIVDNRTIEDLFSPEVLSAPRETPTAGRPVVNASFALNHAFGGRGVTGYHVVNIAIHAMCALAIYGLVRRSATTRIAFAVALLWAVHPLNSEAVNYVTQRTESLMALFYLLTIYCAIRAHDARQRPRWTVLAIVACALGMASKESMATAPLMVMLYDRVFLFASWRDALRARGRLYAGLAATWLVLAAVMWNAPRGLSAGFAAHDADVWTYMLNQSVMIVRYLWLAVWPRDLVLYYGWPLRLTVPDVFPQAIFVLALVGAAAVALWRWPRMGFLGAWFFVMLAPTSSIVPIATEVGAERRMYLASIAVIALAVLLWRRLVPSDRAGAVALASVALLLAAGTVARNRDYRSSLRLAQTTHERWPTSGSASMYGTELAAAGRLDEAERHLRAAAPVHPPAAYFLGTVLAAQGKRAEAIDEFRAYIATQPGELDQVHLARALLADALTRERRPEEAAAVYREMLAVRPQDADASRLLAQILLSQEKYQDAAAHYRAALAVNPNDVPSLGGLGIALASSGQLEEAIKAFQRAADLDPGNPHTQQNLQRALAMRRR